MYRRFAHRRDRWRHGPGCAWGGSATLWESPGAAPPVSLPLVYQLVTSLSLALSGAAARPAPAAPGIITTVSDGLMAPTDADETERVGFVLQNFQSRRRLMRHRIDQSHNTPRLARSGQRPAAIDWPPVRTQVGLLPAALARQSCRACPASLAPLARLGWLLGMTTSQQ